MPTPKTIQQTTDYDIDQLKQHCTHLKRIYCPAYKGILRILKTKMLIGRQHHPDAPIEIFMIATLMEQHQQLMAQINQLDDLDLKIKYHRAYKFFESLIKEK